MRHIGDPESMALASRWENDHCPALAVYASTGKVTPGLRSEVEYLIIRQAEHVEKHDISPWIAKREMEGLLAFSRLLQKKITNSA